MLDWDNPTVTGLLGLIFGSAAAYLQSALAARAKAGEELRGRRLEAYPALWATTAVLSYYPRPALTWDDVRKLHLDLRRWYFTAGGMFLSERGRARYGDVQELIAAQLPAERERKTGVPPNSYFDLADTCSALRTTLAEDLATRRPTLALA